VLTSAMLVAAILGVVDINGARDYYHCSDGPKCARGYNDLPSRCYCAAFGVVCIQNSIWANIF
jgi:hypothetical protein